MGGGHSSGKETERPPSPLPQPPLSAAPSRLSDEATAGQLSPPPHISGTSDPPMTLQSPSSAPPMDSPVIGHAFSGDSVPAAVPIASPPDPVGAINLPGSPGGAASHELPPRPASIRRGQSFSTSHGSSQPSHGSVVAASLSQLQQASAQSTGLGSSKGVESASSLVSMPRHAAAAVAPWSAQATARDPGSPGSLRTTIDIPAPSDSPSSAVSFPVSASPGASADPAHGPDVTAPGDHDPSLPLALNDVVVPSIGPLGDGVPRQDSGGDSRLDPAALMTEGSGEQRSSDAVSSTGVSARNAEDRRRSSGLVTPTVYLTPTYSPAMPTPTASPTSADPPGLEQWQAVSVSPSTASLPPRRHIGLAQSGSGFAWMGGTAKSNVSSFSRQSSVSSRGGGLAPSSGAGSFGGDSNHDRDGFGTVHVDSLAGHGRSSPASPFGLRNRNSASPLRQSRGGTGVRGRGRGRSGFRGGGGVGASLAAAITRGAGSVQSLLADVPSPVDFVTHSAGSPDPSVALDESHVLPHQPRGSLRSPSTDSDSSNYAKSAGLAMSPDLSPRNRLRTAVDHQSPDAPSALPPPAEPSKRSGRPPPSPSKAVDRPLMSPSTGGPRSPLTPPSALAVRGTATRSSASSSDPLVLRQLQLLSVPPSSDPAGNRSLTASTGEGRLSRRSAGTTQIPSLSSTSRGATSTASPRGPTAVPTPNAAAIARAPSLRDQDLDLPSFAPITSNSAEADAPLDAAPTVVATPPTPSDGPSVRERSASDRSRAPLRLEPHSAPRHSEVRAADLPSPLAVPDPAAVDASPDAKAKVGGLRSEPTAPETSSGSATASQSRVTPSAPPETSATKTPSTDRSRSGSQSWRHSTQGSSVSAPAENAPATATDDGRRPRGWRAAAAAIASSGACAPPDGSDGDQSSSLVRHLMSPTTGDVPSGDKSSKDEGTAPAEPSGGDADGGLEGTMARQFGQSGRRMYGDVTPPLDSALQSPVQVRRSQSQTQRTGAVPIAVAALRGGDEATPLQPSLSGEADFQQRLVGSSGSTKRSSLRTGTSGSATGRSSSQSAVDEAALQARVTANLRATALRLADRTTMSSASSSLNGRRGSGPAGTNSSVAGSTVGLWSGGGDRDAGALHRTSDTSSLTRGPSESIRPLAIVLASSPSSPIRGPGQRASSVPDTPPSIPTHSLASTALSHSHSAKSMMRSPAQCTLPPSEYRWSPAHAALVGDATGGDKTPQRSPPPCVSALESPITHSNSSHVSPRATATATDSLRPLDVASESDGGELQLQTPRPPPGAPGAQSSPRLSVGQAQAQAFPSAQSPNMAPIVPRPPSTDGSPGDPSPRRQSSPAAPAAGQARAAIAQQKRQSAPAIVTHSPDSPPCVPPPVSVSSPDKAASPSVGITTPERPSHRLKHHAPSPPRATAYGTPSPGRKSLRDAGSEIPPLAAKPPQRPVEVPADLEQQVAASLRKFSALLREHDEETKPKPPAPVPQTAPNGSTAGSSTAATPLKAIAPPKANSMPTPSDGHDTKDTAPAAVAERISPPPVLTPRTDTAVSALTAPTSPGDEDGMEHRPSFLLTEAPGSSSLRQDSSPTPKGSASSPGTREQTVEFMGDRRRTTSSASKSQCDPLASSKTGHPDAAADDEAPPPVEAEQEDTSAVFRTDDVEKPPTTTSGPTGSALPPGALPLRSDTSAVTLSTETSGLSPPTGLGSDVRPDPTTTTTTSGVLSQRPPQSGSLSDVKDDAPRQPSPSTQGSLTPRSGGVPIHKTRPPPDSLRVRVVRGAAVVQSPSDVVAAFDAPSPGTTPQLSPKPSLGSSGFTGLGPRRPSSFKAASPTASPSPPPAASDLALSSTPSGTAPAQAPVAPREGSAVVAVRKVLEDTAERTPLLTETVSDVLSAMTSPQVSASVVGAVPLEQSAQSGLSVSASTQSQSRLVSHPSLTFRTNLDLSRGNAQSQSQALGTRGSSFEMTQSSRSRSLQTGSMSGSKPTASRVGSSISGRGAPHLSSVGFQSLSASDDNARSHSGQGSHDYSQGHHHHGKIVSPITGSAPGAAVPLTPDPTAVPASEDTAGDDMEADPPAETDTVPQRSLRSRVCSSDLGEVSGLVDASTDNLPIGAVVVSAADQSTSEALPDPPAAPGAEAGEAGDGDAKSLTTAQSLCHFQALHISVVNPAGSERPVGTFDASTSGGHTSGDPVSPLTVEASRADKSPLDDANSSAWEAPRGRGSGRGVARGGHSSSPSPSASLNRPGSASSRTSPRGPSQGFPPLSPPRSPSAASAKVAAAQRPPAARRGRGGISSPTSAAALMTVALDPSLRSVSGDVSQRLPRPPPPSTNPGPHDSVNTACPPQTTPDHPSTSSVLQGAMSRSGNSTAAGGPSGSASGTVTATTGTTETHSDITFTADGTRVGQMGTRGPTPVSQIGSRETSVNFPGGGPVPARRGSGSKMVEATSVNSIATPDFRSVTDQLGASNSGRTGGTTERPRSVRPVSEGDGPYTPKVVTPSPHDIPTPTHAAAPAPHSAHIDTDPAPDRADRPEPSKDDEDGPSQTEVSQELTLPPVLLFQDTLPSQHSHSSGKYSRGSTAAPAARPCADFKPKGPRTDSDVAGTPTKSSVTLLSHKGGPGVPSDSSAPGHDVVGAKGAEVEEAVVHAAVPPAALPDDAPLVALASAPSSPIGTTLGSSAQSAADASRRRAGSSAARASAHQRLSSVTRSGSGDDARLGRADASKDEHPSHSMKPRPGIDSGSAPPPAEVTEYVAQVTQAILSNYDPAAELPLMAPVVEQATREAFRACHAESGRRGYALDDGPVPVGEQRAHHRGYALLTAARLNDAARNTAEAPGKQHKPQPHQQTLHPASTERNGVDGPGSVAPGTSGRDPAEVRSPTCASGAAGDFMLMEESARLRGLSLPRSESPGQEHHHGILALTPQLAMSMSARRPTGVSNSDEPRSRSDGSGLGGFAGGLRVVARATHSSSIQRGDDDDEASPSFLPSDEHVHDPRRAAISSGEHTHTHSGAVHTPSHTFGRTTGTGTGHGTSSQSQLRSSAKDTSDNPSGRREVSPSSNRGGDRPPGANQSQSRTFDFLWASSLFTPHRSLSAHGPLGETPHHRGGSGSSMTPGTLYGMGSSGYLPMPPPGNTFAAQPPPLSDAHPSSPPLSRHPSARLRQPSGASGRPGGDEPFEGIARQLSDEIAALSPRPSAAVTSPLAPTPGNRTPRGEGSPRSFVCQRHGYMPPPPHSSSSAVAALGASASGGTPGAHGALPPGGSPIAASPPLPQAFSFTAGALLRNRRVASVRASSPPQQKR